MKSVLISWVRKLRFREIKWHNQGHMDMTGRAGMEAHSSDSREHALLDTVFPDGQ